MKILRATTYPPDLNPMTIVVRECDVTVPLEEVGGEEFGFLVTDIFSLDGKPNIAHATMIAGNRQGACKDTERNQAILFYWTLAQFKLLKDGGKVLSDKPMPLTAEQIRYVWKQLAKLEQYRDFDFLAIPSDGERPISFKTGRES
jgi:hypothetical protein